MNRDFTVEWLDRKSRFYDLVNDNEEKYITCISCNRPSCPITPNELSHRMCHECYKSWRKLYSKAYRKSHYSIVYGRAIFERCIVDGKVVDDPYIKWLRSWHPSFLRTEWNKWYKDTHPIVPMSEYYMYFKYKLTRRHREAILKQQEYKCKICHRPITYEDAKTDHDHQTGKVRGLLCHRCNTDLGIIENLQVPIEEYLSYVERNQN